MGRQHLLLTFRLTSLYDWNIGLASTAP